MKTIKQIQEKASQLYKQMDWKEFDNGTKRVIITAEPDHALYNDLINLTYKVNESTSLGIDSTYRFTMEALGQIADTTGLDIEDIREVSNGMEADIYTNDLTSWLAENNNHVYYLTQVLEEFSPVEDGSKALAMAQLNAKVEALDVVLNWLLEYKYE